ncbi:MAG: FecR family protein [Gallionella sp.]|nr:FecR family protein [Gallionella sp.]
MSFIKLGLALIACVAGTALSGNSLASESIEVVRARGSVAIKQNDQQKDQPVASRSILPARHILVTGPDGRAVVRIGEAGYIVVEKNSKIEIGREEGHAQYLRQFTGMIYYAVNFVRGSQQPMEIRTATATIGIRGTRFLVADLPERKEIGVRKGLVSVTSPGEAFEIHKKTQEDEFEAFKREAQEAIAEEKRKFSEYKADTEREFIEYKREFGLGANRMATFDGNRVDERPLSDESRKDMETLEAYAKEWIAEVRD